MTKTLAEIQKEFELSKNANSPWLKLASGESVDIVTVRSMKADTKTDDKTGVTSAILSIDMDVDTVEGLKVKKLNTGSSKLVQQLVEKGVDIGSSFTIKKTGEGLQTVYEISNVVNKPKPGAKTGEEVEPQI